MVYPIWERLKAGNRYVFTQINRKHQPIQFDSNTGTFRVYTFPNTSSHSFDTYITPEQFNNNKSNTVNDNNPVQLKEIQIIAKKPTQFVGIQRTPDDHQAALARDRAVDAKVNPQNDQLQSFFANLMTGGMYSAVDQGAKNLAKGNYLEGAAQTATPIMFGPAKSTVANLVRLGEGAYDVLSKNGVQKTYNLAKQGNLSKAAISAAGDALNLGMAIGGGYNLNKEYILSKNISPKTLYLSYKLNITSPKYFYGLNDDINLENKFLGNNYFHQMNADKIQGAQLKGVNNQLWWDKRPFYNRFRQHYTFIVPKSEMPKYKIGTGDANGIVIDNSKSYPITSNMNLSDMLLIKPAYSSKDKITPLNVTQFGNLNSKIKEGVNELQLTDTPKTTRYQFDSPTYQMYTGPQHNISEVLNADGSVNLRNLLSIQNEALKNIPKGTIARHRLENKKWHLTDWNTFLHTRDVYKRALQYNYPKEALFPSLMHDAGKLWVGEGHGPYGASIIQQIFPEASKEQIQAIYGHMDANPSAQLTRFVKGVDIKEPNQFRYVQH